MQSIHNKVFQKLAALKCSWQKRCRELLASYQNRYALVSVPENPCLSCEAALEQGIGLLYLKADTVIKVPVSKEKATCCEVTKDLMKLIKQEVLRQ
jgi:hypothetical protein